MKIVTFTLGDEIYGLEIERIREIIMDPEVTSVPNLPSFLKGIIKLRDSMIPIVEGVERLGYPIDSSPDPGRGKVLIVEYDEHLIGIRIGEARQVIEINEQDIREAPGLINRMGADFVRAVVELDMNSSFKKRKNNDRKENFANVLLLDLEKIFTSEEINKIKSVDPG